MAPVLECNLRGRDHIRAIVLWLSLGITPLIKRESPGNVVHREKEPMLCEMMNMVILTITVPIVIQINIIK